MTRDRLQYEIFYRLWRFWHCSLRYHFKPFMRWHPGEHFGSIGERDLIRHGEFRPIFEGTGYTRPWWHICCNGDAGGWRTHLCDWMEHKWRYTKYYEGDTNDT